MLALPFETALAALLEPLERAAADDFAQLASVGDLESRVAQQTAQLAALSIPPDAQRIALRVRAHFETPLSGDARRKAVGDALEWLAPLRTDDWADTALARNVSTLPGVGPRRAEALARRGLAQVVDLLFHLPTRYDDRRRIEPVSALVVGARATFAGEVLVAGSKLLRGGRSRGARMFQAVLSDGSGKINLKWFRFGETLEKQLRRGQRLRASGEVSRYRFDLEVVHPEIDLLAEGETPVGDGLVPVYATPEGLPPRSFRHIVAAAVRQYSDLAPATLPEALARERHLPTSAEALRAIHCPASDADPEALSRGETKAHDRLRLEELYLLEVGLALRMASRAREPGIAVQARADVLERALASLPFTLTGAQERVLRETLRDLALPHPMSRLLQGDVGSGKTVIAALAARALASAGHQTALMAPTELLAEQHERTLRRLLSGESALRIALLTASTPRAEARVLRRALAAGGMDLVVGTHALLQDDVRFARLALVVIDEQHRFGVLQRKALAARTPGGVQPHTLVMTATPIPRSLALTVYGDLELSVLDEMPPGRKPVTTRLLRDSEGPRVFEEVKRRLARGEQVYVVYPLVEESEKVDLRAASDQAAAIARALPDYRVDLLHGRQSAAVRGEVMARFIRGETQLLVSTTVIEVGIDVPNATLMVIEHAERFGLAQLHQLRGRIGRGEQAGLCLMVARGGGEDSEARLRAMLETDDGFRIADADLRIRGPGNFLGTEQSGRLPDLRFANLLRDASLVVVARDAARKTVADDPKLTRSPSLARAVITRWGSRLALADVG